MQQTITPPHCCSSNGNIILEPKQSDILLGRGTSINAHPGNVIYRELIQSYRQSYLDADPAQKKIIVMQLLQKAKTNGHRFLKQDNTTKVWSEVSYDVVRRKTGQALRENANKLKKEMESQNVTMKRKFECTQPSQLQHPQPQQHKQQKTNVQQMTQVPSFSFLSSTSSPSQSLRSSLSSTASSSSTSSFTSKSSSNSSSKINPLMLVQNALTIKKCAHAIQDKKRRLKLLQQEISNDQNKLIRQLKGSQSFNQLSSMRIENKRILAKDGPIKKRRMNSF